MNPKIMFIFFFITLGPIKVILPFLNATANANAHLRNMIALRAFIISTTIVIILAVFGDKFTSNWNISKDSISITGAIILFIWSLNVLLQQLKPQKPPTPPEHPTLDLAALPLTVPVIITPAGIAAILYFTMTAPKDNLSIMGIIIGLLIGVMLLNLMFMLFARPITRIIGGAVTLQVAGSVLAVLQASLAIEILIKSIQRLI